MKSENKVEPIVIPHTRHALTKREKQILKSYAKGYTYQEIAAELGIGSRTVGSYVQRIREKLRIKSRVDMINEADALKRPKTKR